MNSLENTSWELKAFTDGKRSDPVLKGTRLTASFRVKLSGSGGVNDYTASYATSRDLPPSKVSMTELSSEKKAGPEEHMKQEKRYFDGLRSATDILVLTKDNLVLVWENGAHGLEFSRMPADPYPK